jgi:hypothetical protein
MDQSMVMMKRLSLPVSPGVSGTTSRQAKQKITALWLSALLLAAAAPAAAQDWIISILEGEAVVVDGLKRVAAVPGLKLNPGAIIETGSKTGLLRLEHPDQSSIDLAADSRAMLVPPGFPARNDRLPQLYLMQGWVKLTARGSGEAPGLASPGLEVLPFKGSIVIQLVKKEHSAFVESGRAEIIERRLGTAGVAVNAGEFFTGDSSRRGTVSARPAQGWLPTVPRAFRDPIPLRGASLRERRVEPPALPGPSYAHLAEWLNAETPLRRELLPRWVPLLRDPDFRANINQHMSQHPEWSAVLAAEAAEARARRSK